MVSKLRGCATAVPPFQRVFTGSLDHLGELSALLGEDPELRLLNVRTGGEFESSHIPGSKNITLAGVVASTFVPKAKFVSGFIDAGLTFSALSNTYTMAKGLAMLPYNATSDCNVSCVVDELNR